MTIRQSLAAILAGPDHLVIPRVVPTERLEKLRRSITGSWESALIFGGGDYLEKVYIPQYVGLVDVASAAEALYLDPQSAEKRAELRLVLDRFLRDLETAKHMRSIYGRDADDRIAQVHRLTEVVNKVKAIPLDHDCTDPRSAADFSTTLGLLREAIGEQVAA